MSWNLLLSIEESLDQSLTFLKKVITHLLSLHNLSQSCRDFLSYCFLFNSAHRFSMRFISGGCEAYWKRLILCPVNHSWSEVAIWFRSWATWKTHFQFSSTVESTTSLCKKSSYPPAALASHSGREREIQQGSGGLVPSDHQFPKPHRKFCKSTLRVSMTNGYEKININIQWLLIGNSRTLMGLKKVFSTSFIFWIHGFLKEMHLRLLLGHIIISE